VADLDITSAAGDPALRRIALVLRRTLPGILLFVAVTVGAAVVTAPSEGAFVSEGVIELTDDVSRGITSNGTRRVDARVAIEAQRRVLESTRVLDELRASLGGGGAGITAINTSQPEDTPVIIISVEAATKEVAELGIDTLIAQYSSERLATAVGALEAELVPLREQQLEQSELVQSIVDELERIRPTGSPDEVSVLENRTGSALRRLTDIEVAIQEREFFQRTANGDLTVIESSSPAVEVVPSPIVRGIQFGLVALFLAVGAVILASRIRGRLHLLDEVRAVVGRDTPIVATVPKFRRRFNKGEAALVVRYAKSQREAESFRYMRSAIEVAAAGVSPVSILLTSASPNEGKTVTSANLALASAQSGRRTFLLDGDLLNSSVPRVFGRRDFASAFRLLLEGELDPSDNIWHQVGEGDAALAVLITRIDATVTNRTELSTDSVSQVFRALKKHRDVVVVDGPPVLAVSDAMILARSADLTFVVCRMSHTTRRDLDNAMTQLRQGGVQVAGVIASHSRERRESYYGKDYNYGQGSG